MRSSPYVRSVFISEPSFEPPALALMRSSSRDSSYSCSCCSLFSKLCMICHGRNSTHICDEFDIELPENRSSDGLPRRLAVINDEVLFFSSSYSRSFSFFLFFFFSSKLPRFLFFFFQTPARLSRCRRKRCCSARFSTVPNRTPA